MINPTAASCLSLLLLYAAPTLAHDLWVERRGNQYLLQYGHGRSAHEGAKRLKYQPEQVKDAACFTGAGKEVRAEAGQVYPVTLSGDCAASWFLTSSGYWSKTAYGTKNLPKSEAGAVIDSWLSVKSVKRIDSWGEGLAKPLGRELEIVPLADPLKLKTGDKLRLAVHLKGQPIAGVTVAYFGQPRGVTGNDGQVSVRPRNPGFQLIQASLETALNDGKADKLIQSTALQFELP